MKSSPAIERFWMWFADNHCEVSAAYKTDDVGWLTTNVSERVRRIAASINWEIGPYNAPDNTFVLCPTIRENLALTRAAVKLAPELPGWHFLYAKPRKQLKQLIFEAHHCTVNADGWRYQLISYNKGEFVDLMLFMNAKGFPSAHDQLFAELVVESLVGEELRLDRIGFVQANIVDNAETVEDATPIRYLHKHLLTVLSPEQNGD